MTPLTRRKVDRLSTRPQPGAYMPGWSCEAQHQETRLGAIRLQTTTCSRLEAWRQIEKLPAAKK